jgi:hypothetical protein
VVNVTLRFYGRFAFVKTSTQVFAVAPNFGQPFEPHRSFMTIRHDKIRFVVPNTTERKTTLEPSLRIVGDMDIPDPHTPRQDATPEMLVWDMAGMSIAYGPPVQSTIDTSKQPPLDLDEMEKLRGNNNTTVEPAALTANSNGEANTVVAISGASATPRAMSPEQKINLGKFTEVSSLGQEAPPIKNSTGIIVKYPSDYAEFTLTSASELQLRFKRDGQDAGIVTVKDNVIVCFSNLCTKIKAPEKFDLEFSQYYKLLTNKPGLSAIVPFQQKDPRVLGEGMGCYLNAVISV